MERCCNSFPSTCEQIWSTYNSEKDIFFNVWCNTVTPPLAGITFKNSEGDMNICSHVYRWDREPYELVFELGFEARRQANTPYESYFNLESFVNGARRPLDIIRDTTHDFISTTLT
ncbi:hypothetical protein Tco_1518285, partial [Tanacetum coccineum]